MNNIKRDYNFGGTPSAQYRQHLASFLLGTVTSATFTQEFASLAAALVVAPVVCAGRLEAAAGALRSPSACAGPTSRLPDQVRTAIAVRPDREGPVSGRMGAIVHAAGPLAKSDLNNFAPRVGLAWNFHPKLVFRSLLRGGAPGHLRHRHEHHVPGIPGDGDVQAPVGDPQHVFRLSQGPAPFPYDGQRGRLGAVHRHELHRAARRAGGIRTCGCRT